MMLTMGIFLTLLAILFFVCLVLITGMHPERPHYSLSELKRRAKQSSRFALELDRYEFHAALASLFRSSRAVLLIFIACLLIGAIGWYWGIVVALLVALFYPLVARVKLVRSASKKVYTRFEAALLDFAAKFEKTLLLFREPTEVVHETPSRLHSHEELAELIERSHDVIGDKERALLVSALAFPQKTVKSIMTPRSKIAFIKKSEFLGPLVLDELHALGHSRLPVIAEDLDHVVGILHLRDLLSLDVRDSTTAEKAMEKKVFYIGSEDTLESTLAAFLRTRHHLFIVNNEQGQTVGVVSLEDVMEALIGRKIIDEGRSDL